MTNDEAPDSRSPWAKIIGPCYTGASVARVLGLTSALVTAAVESLSLLELETDDGARLYPAFQISGGRVIAGVDDVLRVLATGTRSTWTWAQWLNFSVDDETGEEAPSAIEQLLAGEIDAVLVDARHAAAGWRN